MMTENVCLSSSQSPERVAGASQNHQMTDGHDTSTILSYFIQGIDRTPVPDAWCGSHSQRIVTDRFS